MPLCLSTVLLRLLICFLSLSKQRTEQARGSKRFRNAQRGRSGGHEAGVSQTLTGSRPRAATRRRDIQRGLGGGERSRRQKSGFLGVEAACQAGAAIPSLGGEGLLEEGVAPTPPSCWRIPGRRSLEGRSPGSQSRTEPSAQMEVNKVSCSFCCRPWVRNGHSLSVEDSDPLTNRSSPCRPVEDAPGTGATEPESSPDGVRLRART
ncbi:unnamed protein product [Rangifer tarandus platyrhynchus]|uniref:Uncharacterized protein n=2 Tax=Rangifer tarandus platyrhynchus TaxID=3082113 RepID=A0ABN8YTJ1_RANTA|nr:unnamed protein product [Rangifer tarandus platyrhynchus]CAI9702475.1 unnamed protein product [Rangifer tarandus platyrhynchus]